MPTRAALAAVALTAACAAFACPACLALLARTALAAHHLAKRRLAQLPRTDLLEGLHDKPDIVETVVEQMPRAEFSRRPVVQPDHIGDEPFHRTVDQHGRNPAATHRPQRFLPHPERVDDHAFHAIRGQQLQIAPLHLDFIGRVADQRHQPQRLASGFHPLQHFHGVRVGQVGEQHPDQAVAATLEATRHLVRLIVETLDGGLDARAQFRRQHAHLAIQIARDAGLARAGFARDVGDRRAARGGKRRRAHFFNTSRLTMLVASVPSSAATRFSAALRAIA